MEPAGGRTGPSVEQRLFTEGRQFDFFQAVRLLERIGQAPAGDPAGPARAPVGEDGDPARETVRFKAMASHSFPSSAVREVRPSAGPGADETPAPPPEMLVAFMGLIGPSGVLPDHYTALVISRLREKDSSLYEFMNLFTHRLVSLFYRAWRKYRFPMEYEQGRLCGRPPAEELFTGALLALTGMGAPGLAERLAVPDEALLFFAGHLAHYPRCAASLELLLTDYFEVPAKVRQFQGQWLMLDPGERSAMPGPELPLGRNNQLGVSTIVGERVWDVLGKLRIQLGPLHYADYVRFMPSGRGLRELSSWVRLYVGEQFDFDVQLILRGPEVPPCRMGGGGEAGAQLGWNSWLYSGPCSEEAVETVFAGSES